MENLGLYEDEEPEEEEDEEGDPNEGQPITQEFEQDEQQQEQQQPTSSQKKKRKEPLDLSKLDQKSVKIMVMLMVNTCMPYHSCNVRVVVI